MSIIVDANVCSSIFGAPPDPAFAPIIAALNAGKAKLSVGGTQLKAEYARHGTAWRYIRALDQAGRVRLSNDALVDAEQAALPALFALKSDDPHILALARVSKARLLCSHDVALHADFGNSQIIANPRGYVYQNAAHKALIRKCCK